MAKRAKSVKKPPAASSKGDRKSLKAFCRGLAHTTEDVKWRDHLMFSVGGKIYAGFGLEGEAEFSFKCSDIDFDRLTAIEGIIPAPYAARFGWVAVRDRSVISDAKWSELLRAAHALVMDGLPKGVRKKLGVSP